MKKLQYFVKWKACAEDVNTGDPPESLNTAQEEVEMFDREKRELPGPREVE